MRGIGAALALGALGVAVVGHGLVGWLLLAAFMFLLAITSPVAAFCLLPWAVAFGALATLDLGGLHAGATDLLVGALVLAALVRGRVLSPRVSRPALAAIWSAMRSVGWGRWGRVRAWWRATPALVALVSALGVYLLVIVLSGLVATSRAAVAKEALKWAEVLAVVVLAWLWLRTERHIHALAASIVAVGVAEALLGYAQWAIGSGDLGPGGAALRVFGTFAQPNPYAADLNLALPLALALALWSSDARERWVMAAAALLCFGAELLAASRGALLALAFTVVLLLIVGLRRERLAARIAVVGVPLVALAWIAHIIPARVQTRLLAQVRLGDVSLSGQVNDANFSTIERLAHWVAGVRMFAAHPLLGVGAGNYDAAYARYSVAGWPEPLGHAHNYYINAAAETGILGLLAFLAVAAAALYVCWRATHSRSRTVVSAPGATRALALGLAAVVVAVLLHSLVDDLFVHAMELQFALCLGVLAWLCESATPTQPAHATRPSPRRRPPSPAGA